MERVLVIKDCTECWYAQFGACQHPDMKKEECPKKGFVKGCPLPTTEEYYQGVKTCKYYEDTDW